MSNKLLNSRRSKMVKINNINTLQSCNNKNVNIAESIIGTVSLKKNNEDIAKRTLNIKDEYDADLKHFWKNRNNEPYKIIFKNQDVNKKYESQDDLIIHKVTSKDKEGIDIEYDNKINDIKKHNSEIEQLYTDNKKQEHYNKFMYNNSYKYRSIVTTPSDFETMKSKCVTNDTPHQNMMEILNHIKRIDEQQNNVASHTDNTQKTIGRDDDRKVANSNNDVKDLSSANVDKNRTEQSPGMLKINDLEIRVSKRK